MRLAKVIVDDVEQRIGMLEGDSIRLLDFSQTEQYRSLKDVLHSPDPHGLVQFLVDPDTDPIPQAHVEFMAPVDRQEIWAAGVTYKRSQVARMEESEHGASHYDKVYTADRPELFFKATPNRVAGPGQNVRVRYDSNWSVPEPELALYISPEMKLVGYSIGNDMSARDIEGENPLYLPQAKVYKECCAIGPVVYIPEEPLERKKTKITLQIVRKDEIAFHGETDLGEMARSFEDLIDWLSRENDFPNGVILLTGTGIIPPDEFTLENGDMVSIKISNIGTLSNPVVQQDL